MNGNPATELPENACDLSPNISTLDLSEINFDDFENAIDKISNYPMLKTLKILLTNETQVDLIMERLHCLEELNGLPIEREEVESPDDGGRGGQDEAFTSDEELRPPL